MTFNYINLFLTVYLTDFLLKITLIKLVDFKLNTMFVWKRNLSCFI